MRSGLLNLGNSGSDSVRITLPCGYAQRIHTNWRDNDNEISEELWNEENNAYTSCHDYDVC